MLIGAYIILVWQAFYLYYVELVIWCDPRNALGGQSSKAKGLEDNSIPYKELLELFITKEEKKPKKLARLLPSKVKF